jgi:glycosyltransferase involved in cell wall biosynthesis
MHVMFLGLRGFPGVQGGVESHAEHLCPSLAGLGCQVDVIVRSPYQHLPKGNVWNKVRFHRLWSPRSKGLEAFVHTFLGVLYAGIVKRPDILHIQAIGPAIMTPLARLLGLRVVVTHHGPDYDRQKWGRFGKLLLRLGEGCGMRWSNERIVISEVIQQIVRSKYGRDSVLIPNGVVIPEMPHHADAPLAFGLEPARYVLLVSRLVPEKRHLDLIDAFKTAALPGWKLAIVGALDHPDAYVQSVLDSAAATLGVVCTGLQTGQALKELYAHAGIFVLPSSHEGLPIAMLEALSYGLPVVASNIPANLEVGLPKELYFPLGQVDALAARLTELAAVPLTDEVRQMRRAWVSDRFDWHDIACRTIAVYQEVCSGAKAQQF